MLACCLAVFLTMAPGASSFPSQPTLVVDRSCHFEPPYASVDRDGRWMVTGSWGSEIRVWTYPDVKLFRTIRLPIGLGNEGDVGVPAFSADGSTIAIGTIRPSDWNGSDGRPGYAIYVIDRATGKVVNRVTGLPNAVTWMAVSPAGDRIAAGTSVDRGNCSLVLYDRSAGMRVIARDDGFRDTIFGIDFSLDGTRIVTTSRDGSVALYSGQGEHIARRLYGPDNDPRMVKFSPDGTRIAVGGIVESLQPGEGPGRLRGIDIFSGTDLSYLGTASSEGKASGLFDMVGWCGDGKTLVGGMTARDKNGRFIVRMWSKGGLGPWKDVPFDYYIGAVSGAVDGALVACQDATFWRVTLDGTKTELLGCPQFPFPMVRMNEAAPVPEERLVFADSSLDHVSAPLEAQRERLDFVVSSRSAASTMDDLRSTGLRVPVRSTPALRVEPGGGMAPLLNGVRVAPQISRANVWCVLPHDAGIVIGAQWAIQRISPAGQRVWLKIIPLEAFGINVSEDGRIVVAIFRDHTVRWYRTSDGKEILALFVDKSTMGWVLWTPEGYYDCSLLAERFLCWQLNTSPEEASRTFPIGTYRDTYYRPDVIDRVLGLADVNEAVKSANEARFGVSRGAEDIVMQDIPPEMVVSLVQCEVAEGKLELRVKGTIAARPGQELEWAEVRVDSKAVKRFEIGKQQTSSSVLIDERFSFDQTPGVVQFYAWTGSKGAISDPIPVQGLRGAESSGPRINELNAGVFRPRRYFLLCLGINSYGPKANLPTLGFAEDDARAFAREFEDHKIPGSEVYPHVLVGSQVTLPAMKSEMLKIRNLQPTGNDTIVVYLAGHGLIQCNDGKDGVSSRFAFPMSDYDPSDPDTTFTAYEFEKWLNLESHCPRLLFLDTCNAGAISGNLPLFDSRLSIGIMAACASGAAAREQRGGLPGEPSSGHGNFTRCLIDAIRGGEDNAAVDRFTRFVTLKTMDAYVSGAANARYGQKPVNNVSSCTDPFAISRGR